MSSTTSLRRASRRIHVLGGVALGGCLMNPLLDPDTALFLARFLVVATSALGWAIPGSWKRFSRRAPRRTATTALQRA